MNEPPPGKGAKPVGWPANEPPRRTQDWAAFADSDRRAGIQVTEDFQRFNQRNDMFSRSLWDETVKSKESAGFWRSYRDPQARKGDGFRQRDFAIRNAAWVVANAIMSRRFAEGAKEGFTAPIEADHAPVPIKAEVTDAVAMAAEIKRVGAYFGADLMGITEYDERWVYATRFDHKTKEEVPNDLPEGLTSVILCCHAMDLETVMTFPSALGGAAVGKGYSAEAAMVMQLAQFIRDLGYQAVGTMNDTSLAIPQAVKAGLGEYGRHNMLITKEFGPRVRISKIFTDLPLAHDAPQPFGVAEFCHICRRCAEACPVKAISFESPSVAGRNRSSSTGVVKWTTDCEKCFGYWAKMRTDCAICLRVCPFNRDFSKWYMRLARRLAATPARRLMLWLDIKLGFGKRLQPSAWWGAA